MAALAGLYLLLLGLYCLCGLPKKKLLNWYLLPVLFTLSITILLLWKEPGTPLLSLRSPWISLTLTDNGLLLVMRLLLKALVSMTSSLLLLLTTRYSQLSAVIYRIFPSPLDQIFLMSYRFLFITLSMVDSMIRAFKARGGGFIKSTSRQSKAFAQIFALVLIRSYDRAERVSKAMEARGYQGTYVTAAEVQQVRPEEYALMLMLLLLLAYTLLPRNLPI